MRLATDPCFPGLQILSANGIGDCITIYDLLCLQISDCQRVRHDVVDVPGLALRHEAERGKCRIIGDQSRMNIV